MPHVRIDLRSSCLSCSPLEAPVTMMVLLLATMILGIFELMLALQETAVAGLWEQFSRYVIGQVGIRPGRGKNADGSTSPQMETLSSLLLTNPALPLLMPDPLL